MKRLYVLSAIILFVSSCNNGDDVSPYDNLLNNPPYSTLTDSIKVSPTSADLFLRRAILLNSEDHTVPALADFRKSWELEHSEPAALGVSGILLDSHPDSALAFLQVACQQLPGSMLLKLGLARAYSQIDSLSKSLVIANELLATYPDQVDILKMKADLLDRQGNTAEAIMVLEHAYNLEPADVQLNYILALLYAENKHPRLIVLTDSLIKADSMGIHAEPYYYKGIYYSNINDFASALHNFDLAIKHDIHYLESYIEKGALLFEMKKYPEALDVFNLALTVSPKFADSYYWIAKCQQATGKNAEAKLNYERAYSLDNKLIAARDSASKLK